MPLRGAGEWRTGAGGAGRRGGLCSAASTALSQSALGPPGEGDLSPQPLLGAPHSAAAVADRAGEGVGDGAPLRASSQQLGAQATLETRQPEVQWSAGGEARRGGVYSAAGRARGRPRADRGGGSRALDLLRGHGHRGFGPDTGLLVQQLERSADGNLVARLFQSVGTTVNRVVRLTGPGSELRDRDTGLHRPRARHHTAGAGGPVSDGAGARHPHRTVHRLWGHAGGERAGWHGRDGRGGRQGCEYLPRDAATGAGDDDRPGPGALGPHGDEQRRE